VWVLELHIGNHGLVAHSCTRLSQEEPNACAKRRGDEWWRKGLSREELDLFAKRRGDRLGRKGSSREEFDLCAKRRGDE
jgi:hypothetical protein